MALDKSRKPKYSNLGPSHWVLSSLKIRCLFICLSIDLGPLFLASIFLKIFGLCVSDSTPIRPRYTASKPPVEFRESTVFPGCQANYLRTNLGACLSFTRLIMWGFISLSQKLPPTNEEDPGAHFCLFRPFRGSACCRWKCSNPLSKQRNAKMILCTDVYYTSVITLDLQSHLISLLYSQWGKTQHSLGRKV